VSGGLLLQLHTNWRDFLYLAVVIRSLPRSLVDNINQVDSLSITACEFMKGYNHQNRVGQSTGWYLRISPTSLLVKLLGISRSDRAKADMCIVVTTSMDPKRIGGMKIILHL
jgi:hypothetical protein